MKILFLFLLCASVHLFAQTKPPEKFIYKIIEFKKSVTIDTVAKVLNYSDGAPDEGYEYSFWYPIDSKKCLYAKAANAVGVKSEDGLSMTYEVNPKQNILDLNSIDKTSIRFASEKISYPSVLGSARCHQKVNSTWL